MNLKKLVSLKNNFVFNSFPKLTFYIFKSIAIRPSATYFPCEGDLTVLSILIKNCKARHVSNKKLDAHQYRFTQPPCNPKWLLRMGISTLLI